MCVRTTTLLSKVSLLLCAAAWLFGAVPVVGSADEAGREIALQTVYLTETVGRAHGISIVGRAPGKARVTLDPNVCAINEFGDRTICTLIALSIVDVDVVQIRLADESSQGRAIYELRGKLPPEGSRWFLVGPPRDRTHYRLVVQTDKDRRRPITGRHSPGSHPGSHGRRPVDGAAQ